MAKPLPDHWLTGAIIALISVGLWYVILTQFAVWWEIGLKNKPILQPPVPQLIILGMHMIVFRQLVVNARRTATGTGFFMVLFLAAMIYLFSNKELFAH